MIHETEFDPPLGIHADRPLSSDEARPCWMALDAAREQAFTGEITFHAEPEVRVYLDNGVAYFAERADDPTLGRRLLDAGLLDAAQLERGTVRVGDVEHLGRLFDRDPSVDRDAVMVVTEEATQALLTDLANNVVAPTRATAYRHHESGVHRWFVAPASAGSVTRPVSDVGLVDNSVVEDLPGLPTALTGSFDDDLRIEWDEPLADLAAATTEPQGVDFGPDVLGTAERDGDAGIATSPFAEAPPSPGTASEDTAAPAVDHDPSPVGFDQLFVDLDALTAPLADGSADVPSDGLGSVTDATFETPHSTGTVAEVVAEESAEIVDADQVVDADDSAAGESAEIVDAPEGVDADDSVAVDASDGVDAAEILAEDEVIDVPPSAGVAATEVVPMEEFVIHWPDGTEEAPAGWSDDRPIVGEVLLQPRSADVSDPEVSSPDLDPELGTAEPPEDATPEDATPEDEAPEDEAAEDEAAEDATPENEAPEDEAPEDEAAEDEAAEDATPEHGALADVALVEGSADEAAPDQVAAPVEDLFEGSADEAWSVEDVAPVGESAGTGAIDAGLPVLVPDDLPTTDGAVPDEVSDAVLRAIRAIENASTAAPVVAPIVATERQAEPAAAPIVEPAPAPAPQGFAPPTPETSAEAIYAARMAALEAAAHGGDGERAELGPRVASVVFVDDEPEPEPKDRAGALRRLISSLRRR